MTAPATSALTSCLRSPVCNAIAASAGAQRSAVGRHITATPTKNPAHVPLRQTKAVRAMAKRARIRMSTW